MRFLYFVLLVTTTALWASEKVQIAVLDLAGESNVAGQELRTISDRLESELISTGSFMVLERRRVSEILQEQGFQQSGACDASSCQVEMGQLLGVDQVVVGSVGKVGAVYTLNVKLVSVSTGEIHKSQVVDVRGDLAQLLTTGCSQAASGLAGVPLKTQERKTSWWAWGAGAVGTAAVVGGVGYLLFADDHSSPTTTVIYNDRSLQ